MKLEKEQMQAVHFGSSANRRGDDRRMKKKLLIELFIYVIIAVVGTFLLFTHKTKQNPIEIPSEFKIERNENGAALFIQ